VFPYEPYDTNVDPGEHNNVLTKNVNRAKKNGKTIPGVKTKVVHKYMNPECYNCLYDQLIWKKEKPKYFLYDF